MLIENRPGAGGIVAHEACAKSPPDGYTFCIVSPAFAFEKYLEKVPYDWERDFRPVARMFALLEGWIAAARVPASTLQDLQRIASVKPDAITFGVLGAGGSVPVRWLAERWMTSFVHVPYKGAPQMLTDIASGQVEVGQFGVGNAISLYKSGKVKVLAIGGAKRHPALPEVPAMGELGYSDMPRTVFWGLVGPAGLPETITTRLGRELQRQVSEPRMIDLLESRFFDAAFLGPADYAEFIRKEVALAGELVKRYDLRAN